jgi:hypothetical protein
MSPLSAPLHFRSLTSHEVPTTLTEGGWNAKMVFTQAQGVEAKRNQHTSFDGSQAFEQRV